MKPYLIEPRDALLFRDGRPFGATGSEGARSMPFPFPSTTAGLMRTLSGQNEQGVFQSDQIDAVKQLMVVGPMLVRRTSQRSPRETASDATPEDVARFDWLLPAPQDALLVKRELSTPGSGQGRGTTAKPSYEIRPLQPLALPPGAQLNLPAGVTHVVGTGQRVLGKPQPMPQYWYWPALYAWLEQGASFRRQPVVAPEPPACRALRLGLASCLTETDLETLGHTGPAEESRTHVGIDGGSGTAKDGALFQVRSRSFFRRHEADGASVEPPDAHEQLGLVVAVSAPAGDPTKILPSGPVTLGGERRLSALRPLTWAQLQNGPFQSGPSQSGPSQSGPSQNRSPVESAQPGCPASIRAAILRTGTCRVLLTTPAAFERGALPSWLLRPDVPGLASAEVTWNQPEPSRASVVGACVDRPLIVSGWDMKLGMPKPSKRLARAGSVYFIRLPGDWSERMRNAWIDAVWMQNISDTHDDRRDGYGLALLGVWDGIPRPMAEDAGTGSPKTPVEVRS